MDDELLGDGVAEPGRPGDGPGRRDLLRAGMLAAGVGVLAGAVELLDRGSSPVRLPLSAGPALTPSGPDVARLGSVAEVATAAPARPAWVRTWKDPIARIDDFVRRNPGTRYARNAIMLTIDDGPDPVWTPKYLRLLARHHVQATFTVIGQQVREHPALVRAVAREGHHLGNHTFHHPLDLPDLRAMRIRRELEDTTDAIVRASGFRPRQFRSPGGVWGPAVFAEVSRQQMMPLGWDIDPRDWSMPGVAHIRSAMLASRPHDIILCHDGGGDRSQTFRALQTVIPARLARGWTFVTLPAPHSI